MPAPRKPSPSSPATSRTNPGGPATLRNPAVAARVRQLAAQAEHRRAIAEFHARRAADQQARLDALLLEAIAALASLFNQPDRTGSHPAWPSRSPTSEPPTPSTPRPAITCTLSTAGSCANSVAANTGRPAGISTGGFPRVASRTRRASHPGTGLSASPLGIVVVIHPLAGHGAGMAVPR